MTDSKSRTLVVIPARISSTRLARKMLLRATGRPLLEHTYEAACGATTIDEVVVATPDAEIVEVVQAFGGRVAWTSPSAVSGTDRLAEVAEQRPDVEWFVNLQGDEPEMPSSYVDRVMQVLRSDVAVPIATLAAPLADRDSLLDPGCVKVVVNRLGRAMYFSRSPIPFLRDATDLDWEAQRKYYWQHLGIYAYRREFLLQLPRLPKSNLEEAEKLEQLRFLEAGFAIGVGQVPQATRGIDTAADYEAFVRRHACGR